MQKTKSSKVKEFVKNFSFENPDWEKLPEDFPFSDTSLLNKEEEGLYSGIVFAWIVYRAGVLREQFSEYLSGYQPFVNYLYLTAKAFFYLLIFVLVTGNLINYFLIEIYHTIL